MLKNKVIWRRIASMLIAGLLLLTVPFSVSAVTPSKADYRVAFSEAWDVFLTNETPVSGKVGTAVYMVYTVESVDEIATTAQQHGIFAGDDVTAIYPYENGGILRHNMNGGLLDPGYTYFFKFAVTKKGFEYVAAKAKEDTSEYITFESSYGDATDTFTNFGIWFGCGKVTAKLKNVHCYTADGQDLGVYSQRAAVDSSEVLKKNPAVDHRYNVTVNKVYNAALSNSIPTDCRVVYMEYEVKSAPCKVYQNGVIMNNAPTASYPFDGGNGYMVFDSFLDTPAPGYMLQEGASYIIKIEQKPTMPKITLQRTYKGVTEKHGLSATYGTYLPDSKYFSLWFGENDKFPVTFEIENFKCYDANGNNLGAQLNQSTAQSTIRHFGEIEDYSGCESVYCNDEKGETIALYADKTAKITRNGKTEKATFVIKDNHLIVRIGGKSETYDYLYQHFTAADGTVYRRLAPYYAVTLDDGTQKTVLKATPQTGYTVARPGDPAKAGTTFLGWYTADGNEFDFDQIITDSQTVYAKWSDVEYQKLKSVDTKDSGKFPWDTVLPVGISVLLLIAGAVGMILLWKRGKRNAG